MGWGQGAGEMMPRGCRDAAKGGEEKDCKGYREQTMQHKASRVNTSSEDRESFLC